MRAFIASMAGLHTSIEALKAIYHGRRRQVGLDALQEAVVMLAASAMLERPSPPATALDLQGPLLG